jgi:hypothetical protein
MPVPQQSILVELNVVGFCFRFFTFRNQEIAITKTTVDIIEICDAYFTVSCFSKYLIKNVVFNKKMFLVVNNTKNV